MLQARWETGMDDSPMWDDAHYDNRTYTMDLNDVGLNSLYALDAESLAALAGTLGKDDERTSISGGIRESEAVGSREALERKGWHL